MHPHNRDSQIRLILHPQTEAKIYQSGYHNKLGEYLGLIHGRPRPPSDIEARNRFPLTNCQESLRHPVAIFRDLKRPMHVVHGQADRDVYAYVATPAHTFAYKHHRDFGGLVELKNAPRSSVFITFVALDGRQVDAALGDMQKTRTCGTGDGCPAGVVLWWEWTESDPTEDLPFDHRTRYGGRVS